MKNIKIFKRKDGTYLGKLIGKPYVISHAETKEQLFLNLLEMKKEFDDLNKHQN